jgi:hypothetical protein
MTAQTTSSTVLAVRDAKQAWRAAAYAVGEHLLGCETCRPQIGSVIVRNACQEYRRVDAVERDAWDALEAARRDSDGC